MAEDRSPKRRRVVHAEYATSSADPAAMASSSSAATTRRGMKVRNGSRPGTVVIVAKASASLEEGLLEIPQAEHAAFEEAERIKGSTDGEYTQEQRALASINSRKFLNKWRERWAAKNPSSAGTEQETVPNSGSGNSRKRKSKRTIPDSAESIDGDADFGNAGFVPMSAPVQSPDLGALQISSPMNGFSNANGPPPQVGRTISLSSHQEIPQLPGPSPTEAILPNVYTQTQAIIMHKVMSLEAGQAMILQRLSQLENETRERLNNIEANMAIMQANQASIDGGVKRILEALQRRTESDAAYDSAGEHSRRQRQIQEQQQLDPSLHLSEATASGDGQNLNPPPLRRVTLKFKPSPVTTSTTLAEDQPPLSPQPIRNGHDDDGMVTATRRSTRSSNTVQASGSEYGEDGNVSADSGHSSASPEESRSRRTRSNANQRHNKFDYDDDDDDDEFEDLRSKQQPVMTTITSSRGRTIKLRNTNAMVESDEEDEHPVRPAGGGARRVTRGQSNRRNSFIDDDGVDDDDFDDDEQGFNTRRRSQKSSEGAVKTEGGEPLDGDAPKTRTRSSKASRRNAKRRSARDLEEEGDYVDDGGTLSSIDMDADGSVDHDDPVPSTPEEPQRRSATPESTGYGLRKRTTKVNYAIPPPLAPDEIGPGINGASSGGVDNVFTNGFGRNNIRGTPKAFRKVIPWGIGNRFGPGGADGA
ncbi:hypothetical protein FRC01_009184, partial [Tulasnella sp. 417]